MQKTANIFKKEFQTKPFASTVQIFGVIVLLLNIWLGTKLAPLAKNIDSIVTQVNALEVEVTELSEVSKANLLIVVKLETLITKLDNIEERLERIDVRLAKHMGI